MAETYIEQVWQNWSSLHGAIVACWFQRYIAQRSANSGVKRNVCSLKLQEHERIGAPASFIEPDRKKDLCDDVEDLAERV